MSDEYGTVVSTIYVYPSGMRYIESAWKGGDLCRVSGELIRQCDPAYCKFGKEYGYIGPFKLSVIWDDQNRDEVLCVMDWTLWHNRHIPKVYPYYVRWVEFWRWLFSKNFIRWLAGAVQ